MELPQPDQALLKLLMRPQLIISPPRRFTCITGEGDDVVVAHSREEKDVVVDCLFW